MSVALQQFVLQELSNRRITERQRALLEERTRASQAAEAERVLSQIALMPETNAQDVEALGIELGVPTNRIRAMQSIAKIQSGAAKRAQQASEQREQISAERTAIADRVGGASERAFNPAGGNRPLSEVMGGIRSLEAAAKMAGLDPGRVLAQQQAQAGLATVDPGRFGQLEALRTRVPEGAAATFLNPATGETRTIADRGDIGAVQQVIAQGFQGPINLTATGPTAQSLFGNQQAQEAAGALVETAGRMTNLQSLRETIEKYRSDAVGVRMRGALAANRIFGSINEELGKIAAGSISEVSVGELQQTRLALEQLAVAAIPEVVGEQNLSRVTDTERRLGGEFTEASRLLQTPAQIIGTIDKFLQLGLLSQERLAVKANLPLAPLRLRVERDAQGIPRVLPAEGVPQDAARRDLIRIRARLSDLGFEDPFISDTIIRMVRQREELQRFRFFDEQNRQFTREVKTSENAPFFRGNPGG